MEGIYYTFIVRIHGEPGGKFRGYIQHIRSQEEAHFESYEDMKSFMDKHIGLPQEGAPPKGSHTF